MKNVFFKLLILFLLISVVLCGCAEGSDLLGETENTSLTDESTTSETTQSTKEITLRVGTYNVAHGREIDGFDMRIIAEDILEHKLDIVGIQEVDKYAVRSNGLDMMKLLSEYTGYEYYTFTKAITIAGDFATYKEHGSYGTGILSKYPISDFNSLKLTSGELEQRAVGYADITVDGYTFTFFNTHLSYEDKEFRTKQFSELAELIGHKREWILTADFNTQDLDEFECFGEVNSLQKIQRYVSHPSDSLAIDNIVFSNNFKYKDSGMDDTSHSDHNLLWGEFSVIVTEN